MEIVAERGPRYQGHSVAGEQSHAASRCSREIPSENHFSGGTALHKPCTARSYNRKVFNGQRSTVSSGKWCRNYRVSTMSFTTKIQHSNLWYVLLKRICFYYENIYLHMQLKWLCIQFYVLSCIFQYSYNKWLICQWFCDEPEVFSLCDCKLLL